MNANDNFEKKDLNESDVTPNSDATKNSTSDQHKEETSENIEETVSQPSSTTVVEEETTIQNNEINDNLESNTVSDNDKKGEIDNIVDSPKEKEQDTTSKEITQESDKEKEEDNKKPKRRGPLTFEEIIGKLKKLSESDSFSRKELDKYQNLFFAEIKKEAETQKLDFLNKGGKEEEFTIQESQLHTEGKNLLQILAEKRKKIAAEEEKLKEKNMTRKLAIIEEIKELTESPEDFNKKYQEFKSLQVEWKELKLVPHGKDHELWQSYQEQVEKFYDIVHLHNEFRDYDFKKNLESKIGLCEATEKLTTEDDIVSAFHQLQKLHKDWRDIGPVARKDRELIWQRFKDASAIINRRYQERVETLKAEEAENYEKKKAICAQLGAIDYSTIRNINDWETKTREVLDLQSKWRQIGYAPRKVNAKIFQQYRAHCDLFFQNKNEYFESIKGELEENLKKKIELCEQAEKLKDSTDWKSTTPKMIAIQREWKDIGMVPRRQSTSVWKRFISACDYFFEQKKLHAKAMRQEEAQNWEKKKEITQKIKDIDPKLAEEEALEMLKDLMAQWHEIGFVPFKHKDTSYQEFSKATDEIYSRFNIDKAERSLENFKSNISEMTKSDRSRGQVLHEREKLMRQFERMKSDLQTYENNIGFLSSSSKKGNVLLDDMNNKIEKIKNELELIVKKIEAIDSNL